MSEAWPTPALQPIAEGFDFSKRLIEVVRGNESEVLQFLVAALQFGGIFFQVLFVCLLGGYIREGDSKAVRSTPVCPPEMIFSTGFIPSPFE